jgi:serine/threonine protein phosphatase 1
MPGRTIVIGDIHGCDVALDVLLRELAPAAGDTVIQLGDVVDRGPDTRACIDRMLELRTQCRLIHLLGNHEEMFLDALAGGAWSNAWLGYGGREMLAAYGGSLDAVPSKHVDYIKAGRDYHESPTDLFVHAAINPALPLEQQTAHFLRWNRLTARVAPHVSGKRVICGHTSQKAGRPLVFDGWVCLDTCAYCPGGALTALVVGEDRVYQADQTGAYRGEFALADFA